MLLFPEYPHKPLQKGEFDMCMHGPLFGPLGAPLNAPTLSAMNGEERKFWEDFLEEADRVLDEKPLDENPPYDPPDSLREKYLRAVLEFDGQRYCQVKQLEQLFMF